MPFKKGCIPWNKETKGLIKPNSGSFKKDCLYGIQFKKNFIPWNKGLKGVQIAWNKGKKYPQFSGKNNSNWKGGKYNQKGYIYLLKPNHPFCNNIGYVPEHRLVIEKYIGRYLIPKEKTHHLEKRSNNHPKMLMAFISQSAHIRFEKNPNNVKLEEIIFDGRVI